MQPSLIIFPVSHQEIERILQYANKYQLGIIIDDGQKQQENFQKPIVKIGLKNINHIKLDKQNQVVGSGITFKQLNESLMKDGFYINIDKKDEDRTIYDVINSDDAYFQDFQSIRQIVLYLKMVLGNGQSIDSGFQFNQKSSLGFNFTDILIGTRSQFAVVSEVNLKVQKYKNQQKYIYQFDENIQIDESYQNQMLIRNNKIYFQTDKKLKNKEIQMEQQNFYQKFMHFRVPISKFQKVIDQLNIYLKQNIIQLDMNMNQGDIAVNLNKNLIDMNQLAIIEQQIKNIAINYNGFLINHAENYKSLQLKNDSILQEYGRNNLLLFRQIKNSLDPKNVLQNQSFSVSIIKDIK